MSVHIIEECIHGVVVRQCRCPAPKKRKVIVSCPDSCQVIPPAKTMIGVEQAWSCISPDGKESVVTRTEDEMFDHLKRGFVVQSVAVVTYEGGSFQYFHGKTAEEMLVQAAKELQDAEENFDNPFN